MKIDFKIRPDLLSSFEKKIEKIKLDITVKNVGNVLSVGDGVAVVSGLARAKFNELLEFKSGVYGVAFNLARSQVGVIVLGDFTKIKEGDEVKTTGRVLTIGVGDKILGRVVNPLAEPKDEKGRFNFRNQVPIEKIAPGVIYRQPVNTPLQTGIKAIDSMIPIGRGQRELIIGDRGVGKTAIVIDTIINQRQENIICIYVAIGQKESSVAQIYDTLKKHKAMDYTVIVDASASEPTSLQYLAPYAGCAIGEYFMDKGKDVLVIYDDLSKHAWAYREISLILKRPSGREAYPGDIFYLHSRLLERACRLGKKHGGGSMTALPIVETQEGDVSAYIPTNIISITDGQIYLESDLFHTGIRPAVNPGLSVSRVGGAAQIKAMKKVAGKLRLDLAQYRELAAFAQFEAELDEATKKQLNRGVQVTEVLKQNVLTPMAVEKQVVLFWLVTEGFLDQIKTGDIRGFGEEFLAELGAKKKQILTKLREEKFFTKKLEEDLFKFAKKFKTGYLDKYEKQTVDQKKT